MRVMTVIGPVGSCDSAHQRPRSCLFASACAVWLAWIACTALAEDVVSNEQPLEEIIANLAANEELYSDIEMLVHRDYQHVRELEEDEDTTGLIKSSSRDSRLVYQGSWFYHRRDDDSVIYGGKKYQKSILNGYDGQQTRIVKDSKIANIHPVRYETHVLMRPHTLLFRSRNMRLSEYLSAGRYRFWERTCIFEGEEEVEGLACFRLRLETRHPGETELSGYRLIWLAPERNYMPVKVVGYLPGYSKEIPLELGEASDFREIAPGVWFPFRANVTVNYETAAAKGEVLESNKTEYRIKKAELDPQYDVSLFRDIEIPDGAAVYHMEDGEVVDSYVQGEQTMEEQEMGAGGWRRWLIIANVGVLLAVACALALRRAIHGQVA